jgi:glycerate kinase
MAYPVTSRAPLLKWRRQAAWSWSRLRSVIPKTTSWGTGELIRHALDAGVKHIIIGIGGSATNDGGAGMVQALGAKLLDDRASLGQGGGELGKLARIDLSGLDRRLAECRIEVACDVTNPLTGKDGASAVFGPQKGPRPR